jgi:hypothetical protein
MGYLFNVPFFNQIEIQRNLFEILQLFYFVIMGNECLATTPNQKYGKLDIMQITISNK